MNLTLPEIKDAVIADFAARGIAVPVLYGTWETHRHRADTRVILGLRPGPGSFDIQAPGPANAPGYIYDAGEALIGRALASDYQIAKAWIYAKPDPTPKLASRTELVQKAAQALKHQLWRAITRFSQGSVAPVPGSGEWPDEGRLEGVIYGSLCTFEFSLAIPILDDPLVIPVIDPDVESGSSLELTVPG